MLEGFRRKRVIKTTLTKPKTRGADVFDIDEEEDIYKRENRRKKQNDYLYDAINRKKKLEMMELPRTPEREIEEFASLNRVWYGSVDKSDRRYCEKWTLDLRRRIRLYWGEKSVLSGKTKEENGGKLLSCHHVYYQKQACCIWDEDKGGFYARIDGEKYYIRGDPNKFVPLTASENSMVNHNKLKWVKHFEDLIEAQGGRCYIPRYTEYSEKEIEAEMVAPIDEDT